MKKLKIMILLIILSFSFFLLTYFKKRNYKLSYEKSGFKIEEEYIKNDGTYLLNINKKDNKYLFIIKDDYTRKRKLINKIKEYKTDNETCLVITFNNKNVLPSCKRNNEVISYHLISSDLKNKIKNTNKYIIKTKDKSYDYNNIYVKNLNNKKVLVWNYNGFYVLTNSSKKNINVIKSEIYNPQMVGEIDNYLIMPNYDEGYEYKNIKVLNVDDLNIKNLKLNTSISSDTYVLGKNDKSIFIYDPKYEKEIEIVPYKLKYRDVNPYIYNKGKIETVSYNKLNNQNVEFIYDTLYDYLLVGNRLYRLNKYKSEYKELVTDKVVKEIVKKNNDEIYYISDDKLYFYSDKYGEVLMLEYFELNFNYKNIIFIYN